MDDDVIGIDPENSQGPPRPATPARTGTVTGIPRQGTETPWPDIAPDTAAPPRGDR